MLGPEMVGLVSGRTTPVFSPPRHNSKAGLRTFGRVQSASFRIARQRGTSSRQRRGRAGQRSNNEGSSPEEEGEGDRE